MFVRKKLHFFHIKSDVYTVTFRPPESPWYKRISLCKVAELCEVSHSYLMLPNMNKYCLTFIVELEEHTDLTAMTSCVCSFGRCTMLSTTSAIFRKTSETGFDGFPPATTATYRPELKGETLLYSDYTMPIHRCLFPPILHP